MPLTNLKLYRKHRFTLQQHIPVLINTIWVLFFLILLTVYFTIYPVNPCCCPVKKKSKTLLTATLYFRPSPTTKQQKQKNKQ